MSVSLSLVCLWALVAILVGLRAEREGWGVALVALGVPVLGLVAWQHGPWPGLLVLLGGTGVLCWPLPRLLRGILGVSREA